MLLEILPTEVSKYCKTLVKFGQENIVPLTGEGQIIAAGITKFPSLKMR